MKILKLVGIVLACMFLLGTVINIVDPEGAKRRREQSAKPAKQTAEVKKDSVASDPVFTHGYQVGYVLAKSGSIKPSAEELDAMARKSALELGESGGLGFKTAWKQAFWMGWNKGD